MFVMLQLFFDSLLFALVLGVLWTFKGHLFAFVRAQCNCKKAGEVTSLGTGIWLTALSMTLHRAWFILYRADLLPPDVQGQLIATTATGASSFLLLFAIAGYLLHQSSVSRSPGVAAKWWLGTSLVFAVGVVVTALVR
jgi:hypothetical protein